jgi:hypothetical protein
MSNLDDSAGSSFLGFGAGGKNLGIEVLGFLLPGVFAISIAPSPNLHF